MRFKRSIQTSCQSCEALGFLTRRQQWWRGRPWYQHATSCAIESGSRSRDSAGNRVVLKHGLISPQDQSPLLCSAGHVPQHFIRQGDAPPFTDGATFGLTLGCCRDSAAEIQSPRCCCVHWPALHFSHLAYIYHWITRPPLELWAIYNIDRMSAKNNALEEFERRFHGDGMAASISWSRDQIRAVLTELSGHRFKIKVSSDFSKNAFNGNRIIE